MSERDCKVGNQRAPRHLKRVARSGGMLSDGKRNVKNLTPRSRKQRAQARAVPVMPENLHLRPVTLPLAFEIDSLLNRLKRRNGRAGYACRTQYEPRSRVQPRCGSVNRSDRADSSPPVQEFRYEFRLACCEAETPRPANAQVFHRREFRATHARSRLLRQRHRDRCRYGDPETPQWRLREPVDACASARRSVALVG